MTRTTEADWWLYVVRCADGTLYTGISPDVERRLMQHETGNGARYLRGRAPLKLEAQALVGNRSSASRAEYRFKRLSRSQKLRWLRDIDGLCGFVAALQIERATQSSSLAAS